MTFDVEAVISVESVFAEIRKLVRGTATKRDVLKCLTSSHFVNLSSQGGADFLVSTSFMDVFKSNSLQFSL